MVHEVMIPVMVNELILCILLFYFNIIKGDVSFGKDSSVGLKCFRNVWKRG